MVEHHRHVVGDQWPVLAADVAWERRRHQYRAWLADDSGFIFVAHTEDSEIPVGYVACRLLPAGPTFDLGELRGDVDSLVTAQAVRGHGVGSALLDACRGELKRRGARYWSIGVVEANTRAIELYERLGFRPFVRSMLAALDDRGGDDPAGD
jgi:ribosomal protein S18 acetylase RimI-like enzyme